MACIREGFFTSSSGIKLYYLDIGPEEGSPIIFVHGLTANASFYKPLLQALAYPWRVIALDLRGHGLSSKPRNGYAIPHLSSDIRALAKYIGIRSYALIGHCLGALVSFYHAAHEPEAVKALVAIEVPSPVIRPKLNRISCWTCTAMAKALSVLGDPRRENAILLALASLLPREARKTLKRWLSSNLLREGQTGMTWAFSWQAVAEIMRALIGFDLRALLETLTCPVLLIRGSRGLFWASDAREIAAFLPGARSITIQKAGHVIFTVALGPLSRAIRSFLREALGQRPSRRAISSATMRPEALA